MSDYLNILGIDPDKINEDDKDLPKLSVSQITKGLVRELTVAAKSHDAGGYMKTTMKWLYILAPDELKEEFTPARENAFKGRLTTVLKSAKSLHSTRRQVFLNESFIPRQQVNTPAVELTDTPRKARLKRKNRDLVNEKKEISVEVKRLNLELAHAKVRKSEILNEAETTSIQSQEKQL